MGNDVGPFERKCRRRAYFEREGETVEGEKEM